MASTNKGFPDILPNVTPSPQGGPPVNPNLQPQQPYWNGSQFVVPGYQPYNPTPIPQSMFSMISPGMQQRLGMGPNGAAGMQAMMNAPPPPPPPAPPAAPPPPQAPMGQNPQLAQLMQQLQQGQGSGQNLMDMFKGGGAQIAGPGSPPPAQGAIPPGPGMGGNMGSMLNNFIQGGGQGGIAALLKMLVP